MISSGGTIHVSVTREISLTDIKITRSRCETCLRIWGLFLESPGNLTGLISYFAIKVSKKVGCVLTSNEVYFVSLADNFTV